MARETVTFIINHNIPDLILMPIVSMNLIGCCK